DHAYRPARYRAEDSPLAAHSGNQGSRNSASTRGVGHESSDSTDNPLAHTAHHAARRLAAQPLETDVEPKGLELSCHQIPGARPVRRPTANADPPAVNPPQVVAQAVLGI